MFANVRTRVPSPLFLGINISIHLVRINFYAFLIFGKFSAGTLIPKQDLIDGGDRIRSSRGEGGKV